MKELWQAFLDNAGFVAVCFGIVLALYLGAKLLERYMPSKRSIFPTRRLTIVSLCGALAAVLMLWEIPLPFLAPGFYKLDFSELPILLCGFFVGPAGAVACEGVKVLLNLLFDGTTTAFVGEFANFTVGCSMVLPAVIIYHIYKTKKSAIAGLCVGTIILTVFGSAFNAIYLLPKFSQLYGLPLDAIIGMGTKIHPGITNIPTFVLLAVAPLNLIKGTMVSILTMLLYKKVARPLFGK